MIGLGFVYALMALLTGAVAVLNARDLGNPRRGRAAAFWGLWAFTFAAGSWLPDAAAGVIVVAMALLAGTGGGLGAPAKSAAPEAAAAGVEVAAPVVAAASSDSGAARALDARGRPFGNRLFLPALLVPAVTVAGAWAFKRLTLGGLPLVDPKQATLVALGAGACAGLAAALLLLRPPAAAPARETRRLLDAVGWAAVLPQTLAALGAVFASAGVGALVAGGVGRVVPLGVPLAAVAAYTVGMALFTMVLGNAFAAFPVMTVAVGLPVLVGRYGGEPAAVAAIGMLSGFCGTLLTPMAANFNVVPVALLGLKGEWAVVRVQAATAVTLLVVNTLLVWALLPRG